MATINSSRPGDSDCGGHQHDQRHAGRRDRLDGVDGDGGGAAVDRGDAGQSRRSPKGLTQQFTATGTFSDNSTQNLTAQVTWASATTAMATINSSGLATAVASGTSTISATLGGVTGSTVLTVTAATLQSIAVTPANPSIAEGADPAVHGDRNVQRQQHPEPHRSGDLGVGDDVGGDDQQQRPGDGVATGTSTISATLGGVTGSTVLTVTGGGAAVDRGDAGQSVDRRRG